MAWSFQAVAGQLACEEIESYNDTGQCIGSSKMMEATHEETAVNTVTATARVHKKCILSH